MAVREQRRFDRKAVELPVLCRATSLSRTQGIMVDLSIEGCCVYLPSVRIQANQPVSIRPIGLEALSGTVQWVAGKIAGIRLVQPLHYTVVDHLVRKHPRQVELSLVIR